MRIVNGLNSNGTEFSNEIEYIMSDAMVARQSVVRLQGLLNLTRINTEKVQSLILEELELLEDMSRAIFKKSAKLNKK